VQLSQVITAQNAAPPTFISNWDL